MKEKTVGERYTTFLTDGVMIESVFDTQFFGQTLRVRVVTIESNHSPLGRLGEVEVIEVL